MMQMTLKALSALLCYPSADLQAAIGEIETIIEQDGLLPSRARRALAPLLRELREGDIYELEAGFVALFDRSRTLSLNLFEHVCGESRDRGGAMVDLLEMYRSGGFEPTGLELPDHLPVLLEYLSTRPLPEAREVLGDAAHVLAALEVRLKRRESPYAAVFKALGHLASRRPEPEVLADLTGEPDDDPDDLEALDAAWEETEVRFGPDAELGCTGATGNPDPGALRPPGSMHSVAVAAPTKN